MFDNESGIVEKWMIHLELLLSMPEQLNDPGYVLLKLLLLAWPLRLLWLLRLCLFWHLAFLVEG